MGEMVLLCECHVDTCDNRLRFSLMSISMISTFDFQKLYNIIYQEVFQARANKKQPGKRKEGDRSAKDTRAYCPIFVGLGILIRTELKQKHCLENIQTR